MCSGPNVHTELYHLDCELFQGLDPHQQVLLTHGDSVSKLAPCLSAVATSGALVAGLSHKHDKVFGVQFHPEADLTLNGQNMFRNFLYNVC